MTQSLIPVQKRNAATHFFIEARNSKHLSIVNITSVIYIVVLILTFIDVYTSMPIYAVSTHVIGLSVIIANLFLLYFTNNIPRSAAIMLFCMLIIHLVNIKLVGGITNPHFAWIFIFPILAGGTLSWRGQIFFYIVCLVGTIYYAVYPESTYILASSESMGYTFFTRFMCLTVFTLIMFIYYFTLKEKMDHLQNALNVASFESDLFLGVFNSNVQSVFLLSETGTIERANDKAHTTFGFEKETLINLPFSKVCQGGLHNINFQLLQENHTGKRQQKSTSFETKVTTNDGSSIWLEITSLRLEGSHQSVHTLITMEDISARKNYETELSYLARFDHLTRLPNRLSIQEHLQNLIHKASVTQNSFAVIFFDLDKFKNVNDIQGHQAGDKVLLAVAQRMQSNTSQTDFVARLGGDEFVLVIDDVYSEKEIIDRVQTVQDSISQVISDNGNDYYIGSSAGIAMFPKDASTPDDLIQKSDIAMYKAKSSGRGNFEFYSVKHDDIIKRQIKLGSELNFAIERDELSLLFQPIYNIHDEICAAEALVRWKHDEFGRVSPDEFIPISEENGLIVPIGLWVLNESCKALKKWHNMGYTKLVMSVNVSYRQINSYDMVNELKRMLEIHKLNGKSLIIELTERVFADDLALVQSNIEQFAAMGVQTAIDDFGVGYSSLSYLKKTEFSSIKIDRSFIKDIETNKASLKLCAAIASMASGLGLSVTAEGVETKTHLRMLKEMNIDKYQGFLMSKPIAANEFTQLLNSKAELKPA